MGGVIEEIYFGNYYSDNDGAKIKKSNIAEKLGVDVLIEDQIDHAKGCVEKGIKVFMPDCPWNQGELPEGVVKVMNFKEILENI